MKVVLSFFSNSALPHLEFKRQSNKNMCSHVIVSLKWHEVTVSVHV